MTISWKCVEHAQKGPTSQFWGIFRDLNFLSLRTDFQFQVSMFGALYLPNQAEQAQAPIGKVEDLTWYYNFVNYTLTWIITDWEYDRCQLVLSGSVGLAESKIWIGTVADRP